VDKFVIEYQKARTLVVVGDRLQALPVYLGSRRVVVITDQRVGGLYLKSLPYQEVIELPEGEASKTLDTARHIYERLVEAHADRSTFLLGLGGGVICDITGFVAATYMRGVKFGLAPTTLLAQADAAIGGKTGLNLKQYKNIIGAFNQPEVVFCDLHVLETLPHKEVLNGMAEIVKHAAILDQGLFSYLEQNHDKAISVTPDVMERLVSESIRIKASIVRRDERDHGERMKLNFGHTLGHAIELLGPLAHGLAVGIGMAMEAKISVQRGYLDHDDQRRIEGLLGDLGFSFNCPVPKEKVLRTIGVDKKRLGEEIHFVFLRRVGEAVVQRIGLGDLKAELEEMWQ